MLFRFDGDKPIYLQIAEQLEDAVFTGIYPEETQIPSTTEISASERINPATVLKGINILVEHSAASVCLSAAAQEKAFAENGKKNLFVNLFNR